MMWPRPGSPSEKVGYGDLHVIEEDRRSGTALDAHLFFFGATGDSGESALDEEGGELLAPDFGEDGEEIRFAAVGDPHLLAIQNVVLSVGREVGAGFDRHGIGTCLRLGETVGSYEFAQEESLGSVLFLLLAGAEEVR